MGREHNVNPLIFAVLYVLSIPPYLGSAAWLVRNIRQKKPISLSVVSTLVFFLLPSLYIVVFGRNVPWWIYAIIGFLVIYGGIQAVKNIRKKVSTPD